MDRKPMIAIGLAAGLLIGAQALAETPQPPRPLPPPGRAAPPPGAPTSFADIVERVGPAVVAIETSRRVAVRSPTFPGLPFDFFFSPNPGAPGQPQDPFGRGQPAPQQQPQTREARAEGSGFFISADGYIVTNAHVVENADEITVTLNDRRELKAEVVGRDTLTDIAVLKVEGRNFPFVNFTNQATPRVGDWVIAVGNPFGLGGTATAGIVSAYGREVGSTYVDFIQIDAAINRGNSGGPTFDIYGRVIGVNSMIFSPSGGSVGIGFAIPASIADDIARRLIRDGRIDRGYLGASVTSLDDDRADALGLPDTDGALIAEVTPGGPAEAAGLQIGDVVISIDGRPIENSSQLTRQIAAARPGQTLSVVAIRDGQRRTFTVRAGLRPSEEELAGRGPSPTAPDAPAAPTGLRLGVTVAPLDDGIRRSLRVPSTVSGVVVQGVEPRSDAAEKGLRAGDIITRANNRDIATSADLASEVDEARRANRRNVLLFVWRDGRNQAVAVRLTDPSGREGED